MKVLVQILAYKMKTIFFGTPDFVIPIAEALLQIPHCPLVAVITNPDRPVGRKQILTPSPLKSWALKHDIGVIDSASMIYIIEAIKKLAPDFGILAAYGKIIPKELIDLFPKGILVIHPSLLPKYRGASPTQAAIVNGDRETGVTIIKMDEKVDHGPIIAQFSEPIKEDDTNQSLRTRLFQKSAEVLITILPAWVEGRIKPRKQNHKEATFTKLLKKDDGFIPPQYLSAALEGKTLDKPWLINFMDHYPLTPDPSTLARFIRAMDPWPGAYTNVKLKMKNEKLTKRLKIFKAHLEEKPVKRLVLDLVQLEGKNPVSWQEFQKGYPNFNLH